MKLLLSDLQQSMAGASRHGDAEILDISTDSRRLKEGDLFIALHGENFDAHDFLTSIASEGKAAAVVAQHVPVDFPLPVLLVPNTQIALGEIARAWRQKFSLPVIGVAGSNGKTTVKGMIASIFSAHVGSNHYLATKGNLNNEIGVPLTLLQLRDEHQYAVIEMGMNHPGEMAYLTSLALPTVGLVNNAQREHQEFMQSVDAVAMENGEVLRHLPETGTAIFPHSDTYTDLWRSIVDESSRCQVMTFGLSQQADVSGQIRANQFGGDLAICIGDEQCSVRLLAAGNHNALNALAAAACCYSVGIPLQSIKQGLENFEPVAGRLQRQVATNGAVIIDDTYNANPDSVRAAIDVLSQCQGQRLLVLGDMGEVGAQGVAYHQEIGAYARERGIEFVMTLGSLAQHVSMTFGANAEHCETVEDLTRAITQTLNKLTASDVTILIKGSRFMKMERVVAFFTQQKITGTH
jgi:UDP-N-acetylmuramoyl-tripeptide--D-alanyl-D-alanine ligase